MLRKKAFRDIMKNKSQFITIFLMVFLGVFVFASVHSYMDGMQKSADVYYKENNLQDLWLTGENFKGSDLDKVKNTENVKDANRVLTLTTSLKDFDNVSLETNFIEENTISKMYVVDGENFSKDKDGVWVDSYLAKNLGLKVGDEIILTYQKYDIKEKIIGLINTPDHVYSIKNESEIFPTHKDYGYVYLSINEFPKEYIYDQVKENISKSVGISVSDISNDMINQFIPNFNIEDYYIFNNILVDVDNLDKINDTKAKLENDIEAAIAVTDRNSSASYEAYNSEIEEGSTYSFVFTMLFLLIAILSVVTTMHRFVKKQRTQIGTLKALGFKNKKIVFHYVSYGMYISILASIIGVLVGNFVLGRFFLEQEMEFFEVPVYSTALVPAVYILALAVVVIISFVTYLSCRKVLKEPASEALRLEIPKVKQRRFNITTKGIFKNSSLSVRWNLRDITRNKGRTIMGVVGIIGCTMLIVCAFGMLDTMNSYLDWQFDKLYNFSYKLSLDNDYTDEEFNNLTEKYGNATSETLGIEIKKKDGTKETNTVTINDAKDYLKYTGHNRQFIDIGDNGVFITEKLSKTLGLNVGDSITWHIFGNDDWYTTKIIGLNRDPQSQSLNISKSYADFLRIKYRADSIYTNLDLSNIQKLDGVKVIQSISNLKEGMQSMLKTLKMMVVILIVVSVILGFVIIYNLGILSYSEKGYQFATLKVLGFDDKKIKKIFVMQNIWITIVAIIIGLPLGYMMVDYIFKAALGDSYDFSAKIKILSYIYATLGTFIVSYFVNKILATKVKSIDMVTSLKANE